MSDNFEPAISPDDQDSDSTIVSEKQLKKFFRNSVPEGKLEDLCNRIKTGRSGDDNDGGIHGITAIAVRKFVQEAAEQSCSDRIFVDVPEDVLCDFGFASTSGERTPMSNLQLL